MTRANLTPDQFRHGGYLQEVNRLFFHPLGLARAADEIVEVDWDTIDSESGRAAGRAIAEAIERIAAR
jgi:hypothetical protein